ncbi:MAG: 3D-(3,5/4)-trihydroxycyclohexane-1,2-dione acylhydrolase (decyclizing) [Pseudomonadota bacterium]|nr:3D-(3,5/4)-trihydroxycyclohexane-1,2-dione acylhydrolase (decyclizing) [Pseudomonadota bacterium]
MSTVRLTAAQAVVRYLIAQKTEIGGAQKPLFAGVWAIFGHGNVAGLGEALYAYREQIPTYRAHNEQGMANAAIAFAKSLDRRQMMACTTSIGPGATNMVTSAALAHVNRLPVLLLPGDTFATRAPDPVLQQIENYADPTISASDCFRPVSRYWDRITRPEQILASLPRAMQVLTDPADCGPVTLSMPQDVQAMAYDYPEEFFQTRVHRLRRHGTDPAQLAQAAECLKKAQKPLVIAGGGVHYALATDAFQRFVEERNLPVAETQAGKGVLRWDHANNLCCVGATGSASANALAKEADVVLAVGTRLADFPTSSRTIFQNPRLKIINLNAAAFDAIKHNSLPLVGDALRGLEELAGALGDWRAPGSWLEHGRKLTAAWNGEVDKVTAASDAALPTDAQVLGAVNRAAGDNDVVVCAAGGLPGELQKLWRTGSTKGYHLEYGYSCMGYEIAGGLGAKMALPDREVFVMVGDGSYLMLNSEIATSIMHGYKIILVILDNRGYGCINRLQQECGGAPFNNLLRDCLNADRAPAVDFVAHAASMGARAEKVKGIAELEQALQRARQADTTYAVVIDTDPLPSTEAGGGWWDVPVPEVSQREQVKTARQGYEKAKSTQRQ